MINFDAQDLLATAEIDEPLIIRGTRCHGGFDADGKYISPRNKYRSAAIDLWRRQFETRYARAVASIPPQSFPSHIPSLRQAEFLLERGILDPLVKYFTKIGIAESFGEVIRHAPTNIQRFFADDIRGTATAHLEKGLLEAHARDEAGHEEERGHTDMWFLARDVAFDGRPAERMRLEVVAEMGDSVTRRAAKEIPEVKRQHRLCPDLDPDFDRLLERLTTLLFVELAAYPRFAWAEEFLGNSRLSAGEAARIVRYIRQDEDPHVAYLLIVLDEIREMNVIGESGKLHRGDSLVQPHWNRAFHALLTSVSRTGPEWFRHEVEKEVIRLKLPRSVYRDFVDLGGPMPNPT